jgi:NAD(P)-dependent dehydrogenase (short-subunit alcohol dehydrogenase family)
MENVVFAAMRSVLGQSRPPSVSEMGSQVKQVSAECVRFSRPAPSRVAAPGELAAAIAFLASKDASYTNGAILPVDGGWFAA